MIARGAKIDNLVQIAHNVVVGEFSVIAAQAGIAGSTRLGRNVTLAGQVGVVNHIEITKVPGCISGDKWCCCEDGACACMHVNICPICDPKIAKK